MPKPKPRPVCRACGKPYNPDGIGWGGLCACPIHPKMAGTYRVTTSKGEETRTYGPAEEG